MLDGPENEHRPQRTDLAPRCARAVAVWPVLLGVFVLALGVRLAYTWQVSSGPLFDVHQGDARWHAEWARRIAEGTLTDGKPFFRAPLYPFFLAAAYRLSGDGFLAAKVLQHVLGATSCVLVFLLARRAFSQTTALIASLAAALYGPLIYFEKELLIPSLAVFLMLCMLLAAVRAIDRPTSRRWLAAGVLLGLCGIARPNFLLFLPALMAWLVAGRRYKQGPGRRWLSAGMLAAGTAGPVVPVTLHNLLVGGDFVLIASQWGINFEIGNNPLADGKTAAAPAWLAGTAGGRYADNVYAASRQVAEADLARPLRDSEVAGYWFRRGLSFLLHHPAEAAKLYLKKLYYLLNGFEIESNRSMYLDRTWSPVFAALVWVRGVAFPFGLVGPLALIGFALPGGDRRLSGVLKLFAVTYAISIVLFFVTGRFRITLVPIACVLAAHALVELARMVTSGRRRSLALCASSSVVLIVLCNTAWFGVRSVDRSREAWVVGSALAEAGRLDEAIERFGQALAVEPDSPRALSDLGNALLRRGGENDLSAAIDHFKAALAASPEYARALLGLGRAYLARDGRDAYERAAEYFERALRVAPDLTLAHVYLGDLLARRDKAGEAIKAFESAIRVNPNEAYAHYRLGGLLLARDDVDAALAHLQEAVRIDPALARAWYALGNALLRAGQPDEAMRSYERALERRPDLSDAHNNLAALLAARGRPDEAIAHLRRALDLAPDDSDVRTNLAALLRRQRRWQEAIALLDEGLARAPGNADLGFELAWMLATAPVDELRDGPRAVSLAERHTTDTASDPRALDILAAAYAEVGRFDDAVAAAERAARLAAACGQHDLARQIAARAAGYEQHRPHREPR